MFSEFIVCLPWVYWSHVCKALLSVHCGATSESTGMFGDHTVLAYQRLRLPFQANVAACREARLFGRWNIRLAR
jgi:hypothetical protein